MFTSFIQRDTAYQKLEHLRKFNSYGLQLEERKATVAENDLNAENPEAENDINPIIDYKNVNFEKRKEKIQTIISLKDFSDGTYEIILDQDFEEIRALEFLAVFLGLDNVCSNGDKNYPGVTATLFQIEMMSYEIGSVEPALPCLRGNLEPMSWAKEYKSTNTFKQEIKGNPLGGGCVFVTEMLSMYIKTPFHITIYKDCISAGPPFTDTFMMRFEYNIIEIPGLIPSTKFTTGYYFKELKSCMWGGIIKSESYKRSVFFSENVQVPYIDAGVDLYKENLDTKLDYSFVIEDVIDEDPEVQIKNLKIEMLEQLASIKSKNGDTITHMSTDLKSLERK